MVLSFQIMIVYLFYNSIHILHKWFSHAQVIFKRKKIYFYFILLLFLILFHNFKADPDLLINEIDVVDGYAELIKLNNDLTQLSNKALVLAEKGEYFLSYFVNA